MGPPLLAANPHSCGFMPPQAARAWSGFGGLQPGPARLLPQECGIAATSGSPIGRLPDSYLAASRLKYWSGEARPMEFHFCDNGAFIRNTFGAVYG